MDTGAKTSAKCYVAGLCAALFLWGGVAPAQTIGGFGTTIEGGRGMLFTHSAETYGKGVYVVGLQGLAMRQEYPVYWTPGAYYGGDYAGDFAEDLPSVIALPLGFGPTSWLDLSASVYGIADERPFARDAQKDQPFFGNPATSLGGVHLGIKSRLPFSLGDTVHFAVKAGVMLDTADHLVNVRNYRYSHPGTDVDAALIQTITLDPGLRLHLEEGYVLSGSDRFDDHVALGAGLELSPHRRLTLGVEAFARTYRYVSPRDWRGSIAYYDYIPVYTPKPDDDTLDYKDDDYVIAPSVTVYLGRNLALRGGVSYIRSKYSDFDESSTQAFLGITFAGAFASMLDSDGDGVKDSIDREAVTPRGYPVDQYGVAIDTDGDGVRDGADSEIDSVRGAIVDASGVARDGDGDGVPDGIDREPDTATGYPVDRLGVALDDDGDGVPNGYDREPMTTEGCAVDEFGVALDDDEDGVPNCLDKQPDTPRGCRGQVDIHGVALDDDGDGIPNCVDLEQNTPAGNPVDRYGRTVKTEDERKLLDEGVIRVHKVNFATGKATLTDDSYDVLRQVARLFSRYPTLKIRIEGHTDNKGRRKLNMELSQERAEAVRAFILDASPVLDAARFTAVGYGPDRPIASNDTEDGRALNRRVEFVVVNKDELKRLTPVE